MIRVSEAQRQTIEQHGVQDFPLECCGVMLGDVEDGVKIVRELRPLENVFEPDADFEALAGQGTADVPAIGRERRYRIPPETMFALLQEERRTKHKILGFYHSHPNHPAQPSVYDLKAASPWYTYIIVSIQDGTPADLTAWQLNDDGDQFEAETLEFA